MRSRFASARVARLGTIATAASPHVVPCCFALEEDLAFTAVDSKPKSTRFLQRLANLRSNAAACLLVDHYEETWDLLWWIRADGRAEIEETGQLAARALAALVGKYEQYRSEPPTGPVVVIRIERWRAWP